MNDDGELFRRLLAALEQAKDAARDVLTTHQQCGCIYCREVTAISFTLELFEQTLNCRAAIEDVAA